MSKELSDIFFEIIVAEDDPITRQRLVAVLENQGHPVRAYSNGEEAWHGFDREPSRVIISDWLMPKVDGPELCRRVRARPETAYTYFILVTGEKTDEVDYDDAISAGTDDFLIKPIKRDSIWRRLRVAKRILGFTKQIRQLEQLIPICTYCKQVRDDPDYWRSIEEYVQSRTGSRFSHGVCPSCFATVLKELQPDLNELAAIAARQSARGADEAKIKPPSE